MARSSAALKIVPEPERQTYHATLHVTRVEYWTVEAETEEEARDLIASFSGHSQCRGEVVHAEIDIVEPA